MHRQLTSGSWCLKSGKSIHLGSYFVSGETVHLGRLMGTFTVYLG